MSIQITRESAAVLEPRIYEALEIVCNEFRGLEVHQRYRNVFSRLLKPDPLGRVAMMGTDQRDLFCPVLRNLIASHVPEDGSGAIFDFGAGDGQTFGLVADAVPDGTTISLEEPSASYLKDYVSFLERDARLRVGAVLEAGIDEIDAVAVRDGGTLPVDGSIDLALAMHSLYFATSLDAALLRLTRFVRPGGALFCVVADEASAYGGRTLRAYLAGGGHLEDAETHRAAVERRRELLAPSEEGGGGLITVLGRAGIEVAVEAVRQPTRLYGHSLVDMVAFSSISIMADEVEPFFQHAARVLLEEPERIDLRIEVDGVRKGMWSVKQPQWVAVIRRVS